MRRTFVHSRVIWSVSVMLLMASAVRDVDAQDQPPGWDYFSVDAGSLVEQFEPSQIVTNLDAPEPSFYQQSTEPHLRVPRECEAYLWVPEEPNADFAGYRIVGRKPKGQSMEGILFVLRRLPETPRRSALIEFPFSARDGSQDAGLRSDFLEAKGRYYQTMWSENMAGAAWFRHVARETLDKIGQRASSGGPNWPLRNRSGADDTLQMMSGGRAVSENLQLDQQLQLPNSQSAGLVPLANVPGITVRAIDWKSRLSKEVPSLDPLSRCIPHDQYVVFLPGFELLEQVVDRGTKLAKPLTQWFEPQSLHTDVLGFYQHQMALSLDSLTRQIGGTLIDEVAITGSDPYFRTGTDVAVVLQSSQPVVLYNALRVKIEATVAGRSDLERSEEALETGTFVWYRSPDRSTSCLLAMIDGVIVVTNSRHQMEQIAGCVAENIQSIDELGDYQFFRQRYPRERDSDSGLLVVTDDTIRRLCGPKWRISASRRTLARATIAEVTMRHADLLVEAMSSGDGSEGESLSEPIVLDSPDAMPDAGQLVVGNSGVYSPRYGSLDFQTPIAELDIQSVSQDEADAYRRWRERYERRWRRNFDPIALSFRLDTQGIEADLSVIPLIGSSDYQQIVRLVGDKQVLPDSTDLHEQAQFKFAMAIDLESQLLVFLRQILTRGNDSLNPLSWIDDQVVVYAEHDEQWLAWLAEQSPWKLSFEKVLYEAPYALFLPSKDNLRMAGFLVAFRSTLESFAPNLFEWRNVTYRDHQYVVGELDRQAWRAEGSQPELCYVTTDEGVTFSFHSKMIERVIDRHLIASDSESGSGEKVESTQESASTFAFSPQLEMTALAEGLDTVARVNARSGLYRMNRIAWSNIPILNELRRRYPDRDPRQVYQTLFRQEIIEPTGGTYQWNNDWGTYVSSLHGFHLDPQAGPAWVSALAPGDRVSTGLRFQDGGLRAGFRWTRNEPEEKR